MLYLDFETNKFSKAFNNYLSVNLEEEKLSRENSTLFKIMSAETEEDLDKISLEDICTCIGNLSTELEFIFLQQNKTEELGRYLLLYEETVNLKKKRKIL